MSQATVAVSSVPGDELTPLLVRLGRRLRLRDGWLLAQRSLWVACAAALLVQLAGRLWEIGDRDGAVAELNRVHGVFEELGGLPELQKTLAQFEEVGAEPPGAST